MAKGHENLRPRGYWFKHGATPWLKRGEGPKCRECQNRDSCEHYSPEPEARCSWAPARYREIIEALAETREFTGPEVLLVGELAQLLVAMELIDRHLARAGMVVTDKAGAVAVQPALKQRMELSRRVESLIRTLCLSPMEAVKLKGASEQPGQLRQLLEEALELDAKAPAALPEGEGGEDE
jgi:phage terminase small subunit